MDVRTKIFQSIDFFFTCKFLLRSDDELLVSDMQNQRKL